MAAKILSIMALLMLAAPIVDGCDCCYNWVDEHHLDSGCRICELPPSNKACKCKNSGIRGLTCAGTVVSCEDPYSDECKYPTLEIGTCQGNCDGYKYTLQPTPTAAEIAAGTARYIANEVAEAINPLNWFG